MEDFEWIM